MYKETTRTATDWAGNIAAFLLVLVMNWLSNWLPINGQTMPEISARYPSPFTPAGFAFSIWGVIYIALLLFVIYQALPSQRNNSTLALISPLFQINCIANAVWLVAWHYDLLIVSMAIMLCILLTLILIYRSILAAADGRNRAESYLVGLPFSLYIGWITIATIANLSIIQTAMGWDNAALNATQWTLLKLALAGAIAVTVLFRLRDVAFVLVTAWAAYGIAAKQADTAAIAGAANLLTVLTLLLVIGSLIIGRRERF